MKKTVKKIMTLLFVMLFVSLALMAQQKPQYTQYIINNYIINPALTGIENYTDIKMGHRHQWVGIRDAPVTSYLTLHAPIGKIDYKTNVGTIFSMEGEKLTGKQYWEDYAASPPHHGLGIQISNDKNGPFNNFAVMATYAYHMGLNPKTNISAGIGIGTSKLSLNTEKLFFGIDYPVDPAVYGSGVLGKSKLDINAGVWVYSQDFFAGAAALQLVPNKIDFSEGIAKISEGKYAPHLFVTGGYRIGLNEDMSLVPSLMFKYIDPVPVQVDVNAKLLYRDALWLGGNYRGKYGFSAIAGIRIVNRIMVSYSYDYSTTKIHTVSSGTHEIVIGFILGNKYSYETCPRRIW